MTIQSVFAMLKAEIKGLMGLYVRSHDQRYKDTAELLASVLKIIKGLFAECKPLQAKSSLGDQKLEREAPVYTDVYNSAIKMNRMEEEKQNTSKY